MVSNVFSAKVNDPSVDRRSGTLANWWLALQFESIIGQYNLLYGDPILCQARHKRVCSRARYAIRV